MASFSPATNQSDPKTDSSGSQPADRRPADHHPADDRPAHRRPAGHHPADDRPAHRRPADHHPSDHQGQRHAPLRATRTASVPATVPSSDTPATVPSSSAHLPVTVFRPAPDERVLVAGSAHARALCLSAGAGTNGVVAVFVDPCGVLVAIATAPAAVTDAMLLDPAPFARLAEVLGASRVYLEAPASDASAVAEVLEASLWPLCISTEVLPRAA